MTFSKPFYREGNIAARSAAMNHQQLNLSREILIFRTFHADVLQMSRTGHYGTTLCSARSVDDSQASVSGGADSGTLSAECYDSQGMSLLRSEKRIFRIIKKLREMAKVLPPVVFFVE